MGELISIIGILKDAPAATTTVLIFVAVLITLLLRIKDADIQSATSVSNAQNEKLVALMNQNEKLMTSVDYLQIQIQGLHKQMALDAEEHRAKMEESYRAIDEMRNRIIELEDLVRVYQHNQKSACTMAFCPNRQN